MIRSFPNNENYDKNYDAVFGKKQECGCEDDVGYCIRVKNDLGDPPYLATCPEFPDMLIRAAEPGEAMEKAEAYIAKLLSELE